MRNRIREEAGHPRSVPKRSTNGSILSSLKLTIDRVAVASQNTSKGEGFAIFVSGPPSSGKSTIARALSKRLEERGVNVQIIESDSLRKVLTPRPKYTGEERDLFYSQMVYIGSLLVKSGVSVILDATAHKRRYRERARRKIKRFLEVYVECPLEVCERRDTKGLYKLARAGEIKTLPGLQVEYEQPRKPEVTVNTDTETVRECVDKIMKRITEDFLKERGHSGDSRSC